MMSGKSIVIALVVLMVVIGAAATLFRPVPPAPADIAMNKQVELLGSAQMFSKSDLASLAPTAIDSLISVLNLGLRLNDSLRVASGASENTATQYERRLEEIKKQVHDIAHSGQGSTH